MKDHVEVFFHTQQPYTHISEDELAKYDARINVPNTYFDPQKAHVLYNQYHEQYAWADEVGIDGILTNEHHSTYWNMKPSANLDAAVISKITSRVKIAIMGNILPINDPVRMAEELAMLDCYSGGRLISGFVRGGATESLAAGLNPAENRERFEEAHDIIIKCWTTPGPFRHEGKYYHYRAVNPWVLPIQKPHPPVWFPGGSSPESAIWAARYGYPYLNFGAVMEITKELKRTYIETAREAGFTPGPEHFGYQIKGLVADTDEKAQEIGRNLMWTDDHRLKGPREHNDPPGYQSRAAQGLRTRRIGSGGPQKMTYEALQDTNIVVVGSPETVTRKLTEVIEELSPGYILLISGDGTVPHKDVMRSLELLGKEVIPALREVRLQPFE